MTPSEKEKIIKEGFDAIRKVYNLRDDLLSDAGKLEAARESNRKLSDRVANLEVTIETLNTAIDKKDVEIHRLNNRLKVAENSRDTIYDNYIERCRTCDANEDIMRQMIADNHKKKEGIKRLKEELEAEKKIHCCDKYVCSVKEDLEIFKKAHVKLCSKYNTLCENNAKLEDNFHELRRQINVIYFNAIHGELEVTDFMAFMIWFKDTFGKFGIYDEEE